MPVRLLDEHVVNQIAAGEVVERPASVVKELVENALDAGAKQIDVRLSQGGVALVEVVDDGGGMSRSDAMLCIERHATSKITSVDDLVGVATCGFRGEALPSMGSVARLEIVTRRAEDEVGTRIRVASGRLVDVADCAARVGTTVSVRGLFADVPARRKFLKSREVEAEHAVEAVRRALLLRPDVGVRVEHDGREVLRAEAGAFGPRCARLVGVDAAAWREVETSEGGVALRGVIAGPYVHRPGAAGAVYVFAHGRYLREGAARRAVIEAYRGALPPGRSPVAVLDVEVPPETIDVNVHPQKTEVRFANPGRVVAHIGDAVRAALREAPAEPRRPLASGAPRSVDATLGLFPGPTVAALPPTGFATSPATSGLAEVERAPDTAAAQAAPSAGPPAGVVQEPAPSWAAGGGAPASADTAVAEGPVPWRSRPLVGVLDGRYAVVAIGPGFALVDVDRLRRRDLAEVLRDEAVRSAVRTRDLLLPVVVDLGRDATRRAIGLADVWLSLGVEIAAHAPQAVAVHALPDRVPGDAAALVQALTATDDPAAALAEAALLPPIDVAAARGWLARGDETPTWMAGLVAMWSDADIAARMGRAR
jgi:DNA mismatch repair protein MutL